MLTRRTERKFSKVQEEAAGRAYCKAMNINPDESVMASPEPSSGIQLDVAIYKKQWEIAVPKIKEANALAQALEKLNEWQGGVC